MVLVFVELSQIKVSNLKWRAVFRVWVCGGGGGGRFCSAWHQKHQLLRGTHVMMRLHSYTQIHQTHILKFGSWSASHTSRVAYWLLAIGETKHSIKEVGHHKVTHQFVDWCFVRFEFVVLSVAILYYGCHHLVNGYHIRTAGEWCRDVVYGSGQSPVNHKGGPA